MKKLFTICAVLFVTASIYAIDPVTLEGNFNIKKAKGTRATLTINWDNILVCEIDDGVVKGECTPIDEYLTQKDQEKIKDGKPEDAEYAKDWVNIKKEGKEYFIEEWNDEFAKKGMGITKKDSEATHKLNITIEKLDFGNVMGSLFGWGNAGGEIIIGHAEVIDNATGEVVLTIKINHVQGMGHPSDRIRTYNMLKALVEEIEDVY